MSAEPGVVGLPAYEAWAATCDTLHAHTQLLGKLAVALAPPEPELQHAALRLTARGFETAPLPLPGRGAAMVAALDLHAHAAVLERSDGATSTVPLAPDRPVRDVTREVLDGVAELAGPIAMSLHPQEVPWSVPLDEDDQHRTYDTGQVAAYLAAATAAANVLAALRAPYRGRCSPVNAWWGTFDLAVSLFSGRAVEPSSDDFIRRNSGDAQQIEVGWWPGDARYPRAALFGFASPAPEGFADAALPVGRFEPALGEFLVDWDEVVASPEPFGTALGFARAVVGHACTVCDWDPRLAASARGDVPAVT